MNEKRYDSKVINLLLDKYERSAVYAGTAVRNQSVAVMVTKKLFPDYFDLTSTAYEHMNAQMENLSSKGLVTLCWKDQKKDGILQKIQLNLDPDSLKRSYEFVSRKTRREKEQEAETVLNEYRCVFPEFVQWAKTRLQNHESVKQYIDIDHPEQLKKVLYLAQKIQENKEDIFLRRFSIEVFHDSKIAEHEIGSAVSILTHFQNGKSGGYEKEKCTGRDNSVSTQEDVQNDLTSLTTDEVLEEYNIYRNPSWVMLKGCGAPLDLPMGVGISNEDIDQIPWNTSNIPDRILTIENLTSFHQWNLKKGEKDLVIYLGGYANRARRQMLQKLHEIYPNALYAHFGDIDAGGFRIWKHLCQSTGLSIRTYLMDEKTYLKYLPYGKDLTMHDKRNLMQMSKDPFFAEQKALFALMLKKGKKLEQECICEYV